MQHSLPGWVLLLVTSCCLEGTWPPLAPSTPALGNAAPWAPATRGSGMPGRGAAARLRPGSDCCLPGQARPRSSCPRCATAARWWTPRRRRCEGWGGPAAVLLLLPAAMLLPGSLPKESSACSTASSGAGDSQKAQPYPSTSYASSVLGHSMCHPSLALSHVLCSLSPALSHGVELSCDIHPLPRTCTEPWCMSL